MVFNLAGISNAVRLPLLLEYKPSSGISLELERYFSDVKNREKLLQGVHKIWEDEYLFKLKNGSFDNYINFLRNIVNVNREIFKAINKINVDGIEKSNFIDEFNKFTLTKDFPPLKKAVFATMLFELALLNTNPVIPLKAVNSSSLEQARGYLKEIQAGWFLAKFIFKISPKANNIFKQSVMIKSFERKDNSNTIIGAEPKGREIDIVTDDALVSVKTNGALYSQQIRTLYFSLNDNIANKLSNIKKIILVRDALNPRQCLPEYPTDLDESYINSTKKLLGIHEKTFVKELSPEFLYIYYTPGIDDFNLTKEWIKEYCKSLA